MRNRYSWEKKKFGKVKVLGVGWDDVIEVKKDLFEMYLYM